MRAWAAGFGLVLIAGCLELPDFPSSSIVLAPRVVAIVTEPPELTPGHALELSVIVAETGAFEVDFEICGVSDDDVASGQQWGEQDDEDCSGEARPLLRGSAASEVPSPMRDTAVARWTLPASTLDVVFQNRDLAELLPGDILPQETLDQIRTSVGLPVLIEATVRTQGQRLRAVKRVLLSENPQPHTNPPPPRFAFGEVPVSATADAPLRCESEGGEPLRLPAGHEIEIAPHTVDDQEDWIEQYRVINAQGRRQERSERAFYSWYATGGDFDRQLTRAPLRNQLWTAPERAGPQRLWLVVRDGHGGTSACGLTVRVVETPNAP